MPIESATYISDLVATNPAHTDGLSQADSHLRLLKTVIQSTFPNVKGAVTASQTDLNFATGLSTSFAALQASDALKAPLASPVFTGTLSAPVIAQAGNPLVPSGVIMLWSGAATAIPAGYALCNGTNGTPDLRGAFIVGAGGSYAVAATGGAITQAGTTNTAGSHSHTGASGASAPGLTGTTDAIAGHSHGGIAQGHSLTPAELPSHTHNITLGTGNTGSGGGYVGTAANTPGTFTTDGGNGLGGSVGNGHSHVITTDGAHSHTLAAAAVASHTHTISADGSHSHTVSVTDGRPPYYALCYIMKL